MKKTEGVAFLWDESFLWGIMAYEALKGLNLPFDLVRAEDIKAGILSEYRMLFVPGGWASNKNKALGSAGKKAIQDFVADGGNYLGFCGGAGLATMAENGIGLLNIKRKPTGERVPSFSGRIKLNISNHPIWNDLSKSTTQDTKSINHSSLIFHAWWPSQFMIEDHNIKVLAAYGKALPDSFSSDLNVGDTEASADWSELERVYQINLNPERLMQEPSVIEGNYGKGKVLLSLIHFDTPDDTNGEIVLKNLWEYLAGENSEHRQQTTDNRQQTADDKRQTTDKTNLCSELCALCSDLISLGERNFLWFWRNPMLLQWRRGVRGLEYNTLYIMIKKISEILKNRNVLYAMDNKPLHNNILTNTYNELIMDCTSRIKKLLTLFVNKSKRLLILERYALHKRHITYEKCDDPEIQKIRTELFSNAKRHGGLFKKLIDEVDNLLFSLIELQEQYPPIESLRQ